MPKPVVRWSPWSDQHKWQISCDLIKGWIIVAHDAVLKVKAATIEQEIWDAMHGRGTSGPLQ